MRLDRSRSGYIAANRLVWAGLFAVRRFVSARYIAYIFETGILLLYRKYPMSSPILFPTSKCKIDLHQLFMETSNDIKVITIISVST